MKNAKDANSAVSSSRDGALDDELVSRLPIAAVFFSLLALVAAVTVYLVAAAPTASVSHVRIRNGTSYPFQQVVVDGQVYGNIDPGKESAYGDLRNAYPSAQVRLIAAGHELRIQPEDHFGEEPLGRGRFTYALKIADLGSPYGLAISVEPDQR
jgi:hypothetical protein